MSLDDEIKERIRQEGYKDQDGKPILLESLVKREPEWAANVIRSLKWKVKESELDLLSMEQNKDHFEAELATIKETHRQSLHRMIEARQGAKAWEDEMKAAIDAALDRKE